MSYQRVLLHIQKNKIMEIAQMDSSLPACPETFPIEREHAVARVFCAMKTLCPSSNRGSLHERTCRTQRIAVSLRP
jgi:hypothetical protein